MAGVWVEGEGLGVVVFSGGGERYLGRGRGGGARSGGIFGGGGEVLGPGFG